jgi:hypothetical protein
MHTLAHLGFPRSTFKLIRNMLTDASARVSVNGHLTSSFPLNRGTRQGDPISPTLFVISMEALNHLLLRDSVLRGLMISPMHRVKVLLYADDVALFTATLEELSHALELIRHFCEAVAMKVSTSKSKCLPLKWNPRFPLPYQIVDRQHPERYLGYLFNPEGQTSATSSLISNITTTLTKLKQSRFTELTKATLFKTYIIPRLTYFIQCEPQDPHLYNSANRLLQWFLWGSSPQFKKGPPRMALDRLQKPLSKGGLALPNLETLHTAMLAWLLEGALHNHLQHSTPLYTPAWKHQLDSTSSSLPTFNSWKYIQRQAKLITPTLIPTSDPIKILSIVRLACLVSGR